MPPPHTGPPLFPGSYPGIGVSQHSPPATTQASELRAALAQPSILIQQEQMMQQQQRLQQQQQQQHAPPPHQPPPSKQGLRPPTPHQPEHSPSPGVIGLGQHRMPFTFPEPRTAGMARAEPKSSQATHTSHQAPPPAAHTQQAPHQEAIIRPEMHQVPTSAAAFSHMPDLPKPSHPDVRPTLPPPGEPRPGLPQQFYPPDLHLQAGLPFPPGALPLGMPRMGLDPRMMFPGAQHAEFLAHQGLGPMLPGMVAPQPPPQALLSAQGTATEHHANDGNRPSSARPPSRHPTPPSAQPSPRTSTPHTPVIPTAQMAPMAPMPPMQQGMRHAMPDITPVHNNDMALLLQVSTPLPFYSSYLFSSIHIEI